MVTDLEFKITVIDTGFMGSGIAACYLIEGDGEFAIIETGNFETTHRILKLLEARKIAKQNIRYIIPTHVHLDHAGGASSLMEALPQAKLVIHPKGARHMIDPTKLIKGATVVYGEAFFKKMYGDIKPIEESRVILGEDGKVLTLGNRQLLFRDTPGHANHHFCIWDETSRGWFSGDTFGVGYPALDSDPLDREVPGCDENANKQRFVFPTSSPVQFTPQKLLESIEMMMSYEPRFMYLTHFGRIEVNRDLSDKLAEQIKYYAQLVESQPEGEKSAEDLEPLLTNYTLKRLSEHGCSLNREAIDKVIAMDIKLNSQGLAIWFARQQKASLS
ncbi:MAG: MBL fold metallo-hydrolase [Gammaproteobacteria bacterium]|nr:MAG: MBL fold metallo-hydrolase [Gammaproteobacteria bacterium]